VSLNLRLLILLFISLCTYLYLAVCLSLHVCFVRRRLILALLSTIHDQQLLMSTFRSMFLVLISAYFKTRFIFSVLGNISLAVCGSVVVNHTDLCTGGRLSCYTHATHTTPADTYRCTLTNSCTASYKITFFHIRYRALHGPSARR